MMGGEAGSEDEDLWRDAGGQLLGHAYVTLLLLFNRLDILHKEWRSTHGGK